MERSKRLMAMSRTRKGSRVGSLPRKVIKAAVLPMGIVHPRRRGDVVVLLYHRVGSGGREIDLPADLFEEHLRILKQKDRILSLDDALTDEEGGVVLTFDDGFRDFDEQVVPLLERYQIPALLYLATGLVAQEDENASDDALTWPMLERAVATGLVTVGAHTHYHASLAEASEEEAAVEMRMSKELVEQRLGVACRHFAYPWSVASEGARRAAHDLFDTSALDSWKTNRRGALDRQRLGRIPILRSDGTMFFRAKTLGLLDHEAFAYRLARRGPWRSTDDLVASAPSRSAESDPR
jgi:peptidoglycan/xylan/chitin deacetylase (PgdA/CDA1 family)